MKRKVIPPYFNTDITKKKNYTKVLNKAAYKYIKGYFNLLFRLYKNTYLEVVSDLRNNVTLILFMTLANRVFIVFKIKITHFRFYYHFLKWIYLKITRIFEQKTIIFISRQESIKKKVTTFGTKWIELENKRGKYHKVKKNVK